MVPQYHLFDVMTMKRDMRECISLFALLSIGNIHCVQL